jgi:Cyclin D1 binding domain
VAVEQDDDLQVVCRARAALSWSCSTFVASTSTCADDDRAFTCAGDPYVPAGQVTFRAKLGPGSEIHSKGSLQAAGEERGYHTSHRGEGCVAERGFSKPTWRTGELLVMRGSGRLARWVKEKLGAAVLCFTWQSADSAGKFSILLSRLEIGNGF